MPTYIILSTFTDEAFDDPADLVDRAEEVSRRIERDCPDLEWLYSYSTMGPYDVVDTSESNEPLLV
jgi:uncharacterized protein with GYD domain